MLPFHFRVLSILLSCVGGQMIVSPASAASSSCNATATVSPYYIERIATMDHELGVPNDYAERRHLSVEPEARALVDAGRDMFGRTFKLAPDAAAALRSMRAAAARDGVTLLVVSGYRSVEYQRALLRRKLQHRQTIAEALRVNTAPGFSEHHTGCAVDLSTPGAPPVVDAFADTAAYRWLGRNATRFGFHLSYPADNRTGVEFEPWHWRFIAAAAPADATPATSTSARPH